MSRPSIPRPGPAPAVVARQVDAMLTGLAGIPPDPGPEAAAPADAAGVVLEPVALRLVPRTARSYRQTVREYHRTRKQYLAELARHPVGRSLALLAVGREGVRQMERGRVPVRNLGTFVDARGVTQQQAGYYNCHHVVPKSTAAPELGHGLNDARNLALVQTFEAPAERHNPHHLWHALYLNPQLNRAPAGGFRCHVVRPAFPVYPPLQEGVRSAPELRARLAELEPGAALPPAWEQKVLAFSRATGHRPYEVPAAYRELTRAFGELYAPAASRGPAEQRRRRDELARAAGESAAQRLPAGAWVNGRLLPAGHRPSQPVPVVAPWAAGRASPAAAPTRPGVPRLPGTLPRAAPAAGAAPSRSGGAQTAPGLAGRDR